MQIVDTNEFKTALALLGFKYQWGHESTVSGEYWAIDQIWINFFSESTGRRSCLININGSCKRYVINNETLKRIAGQIFNHTHDSIFEKTDFWKNEND